MHVIMCSLFSAGEADEASLEMPPRTPPLNLFGMFLMWDTSCMKVIGLVANFDVIMIYNIPIYIYDTMYIYIYTILCICIYIYIYTILCICIYIYIYMHVIVYVHCTYRIYVNWDCIGISNPCH